MPTLDISKRCLMSRKLPTLRLLCCAFGNVWSYSRNDQGSRTSQYLMCPIRIQVLSGCVECWVWKCCFVAFCEAPPAVNNSSRGRARGVRNSCFPGHLYRIALLLGASAKKSEGYLVEEKGWTSVFQQRIYSHSHSPTMFSEWDNIHLHMNSKWRRKKRIMIVRSQDPIGRHHLIHFCV